MPCSSRDCTNGHRKHAALWIRLPGCGSGSVLRIPSGAAVQARSLRTNALSDAPQDLGRRDPRQPVRVVVLLRYNNQKELERFVDELERSPRPRYFTHQAFLARFAPTAQQERMVLSALHSAGFHVVQRFANRLIVDAVAPSGKIEQLFHTEIHDFRQARYGVRPANVRPLRIPAQLSLLVAKVEANDLVLARPDILFAHRSIAANFSGNRDRNVIRNGAFNTGTLAPWRSCGKTNVVVSQEHPHSAYFDVLTGSTNREKEVTGWSAICQRVTVPQSGQLSAWLYEVTNEPNTRYAYQEVALADGNDKPIIVLSKTNGNQGGWVHRVWSLEKFAGKDETLFFGVHGSGRAMYYDSQFIDDVNLVGVAPSAAPSPTPAPGFGPNGGWGPSNVTNGFKFPSIEGDTGQGETIANVIDSTVTPSDLGAYLQYFNIVRTGAVTNEAVDGGGPVDSEGEATLDVETLASLAPASNIIVYDVGDSFSDQSIEDAYNQVVSDGKATVVNSSFGECETADPDFTAIADGLALGAAAQGVTFSASSGDSGAEARCSVNYATVDGPASNPHFVSVGGTEAGLWANG